MKKFFLLTIFIFFLSSCFETQTQEDWLTSHDNGNFSMRIPQNWEILDKKSKEIPTPKDWEIELSTRSKTANNWFFNNLLISSETPKNEISASDYMTSRNLLSENEYFEHKKIEEKDFIFNDKSTSKIFIYEARYDQKTPKVKFLQTANICADKKAYYITLALENGISDFSRYEYMLASFTCKK